MIVNEDINVKRSNIHSNFTIQYKSDDKDNKKKKNIFYSCNNM